ncbi:MAG: beta-glucosidase [Chitinophagaceae bacterium]|nr:MAG: beta-glucosidase [Chitinophagaceae bacterium]
MKKYIYFLCFLGATTLLNAQKQPATTPLYKSTKIDINLRIDDLLKRMTIEEKAGQLNQLSGGIFTGPALNDPGQKAKVQMVRDGKVGSFLNVTGAKETRNIQEVAVKESRLGIPILFAYDVIHGYKTIFPIPLAEACSWDLTQIEKNSAVSAKESAAAGLHWTFAPMVDISTDPRWGRVMEGAGEDTYYGSLVAAARVRGLQGNLDDVLHILACVKHFAAYGALEAGREYNHVDVSRVALWNKYLPTYQAAVNAGAATIMNSFNVVDGVPASANSFLLKDILQKKWGFKGLVVSDWGSFEELVDHGYAANEKDAAYKAIKSGSMMDMQSIVTIEHLPALVKEGKVSMKEVDDVVRKVLYYKFKLGLFEDPYKFSDESREATTLFSPANRAEALKAARSSIVLLKNNQQVLPLKKSTQKIALVGLYAKSKDDMFDFWSGKGDSNDAVSIYEGMQQKFGSASIAYTAGYTADNNFNEALVNEAVASAANSDVIVATIGLSGKLAGEERSLANINIPDNQVQLLKALQKTGKPVVVLVNSGRPLVLTQIQNLSTAIVQCWVLGTETGNAVADVLSGDYNPSGKTVMSFPYAVGQIPVYYNHFNTNRPPPETGDASWKSRYRDIPNEPLYPFGYGLSYSTFEYTGLTLSSTSISKNESVKVAVTVKNTSNVDGEEVVQLYIRDLTASIIRPVKELKGFQKIMLKAGESKTVQFVLTGKDLSFYDGAGNTVLESGKFNVFVGGDSNKTLNATFELK